MLFSFISDSRCVCFFFYSICWCYCCRIFFHFISLIQVAVAFASSFAVSVAATVVVSSSALSLWSFFLHIWFAVWCSVRWHTVVHVVEHSAWLYPAVSLFCLSIVSFFMWKWIWVHFYAVVEHSVWSYSTVSLFYLSVVSFFLSILNFDDGWWLRLEFTVSIERIVLKCHGELWWWLYIPVQCVNLLE